MARRLKKEFYDRVENESENFINHDKKEISKIYNNIFHNTYKLHDLAVKSQNKEKYDLFRSDDNDEYYDMFKKSKKYLDRSMDIIYKEKNHLRVFVSPFLPLSMLKDNGFNFDNIIIKSIFALIVTVFSFGFDLTSSLDNSIIGLLFISFVTRIMSDKVKSDKNIGKVLPNFQILVYQLFLLYAALLLVNGLFEEMISVKRIFVFVKSVYVISLFNEIINQLENLGLKIPKPIKKITKYPKKFLKAWESIEDDE